MTGTVESMSLRTARQQAHSQQLRLMQFGDGGTTYIGITRSDSDDITEVVDEQMPALAPPSDLFYQWLSLRDELQEQMNYVDAHNEAVDRTDYRERYRAHLETDRAQRALDEIVDRVADGEHIVLVCFCGSGKWCHRSIVYERLTDRLNGGENT